MAENNYSEKTLNKRYEELGLPQETLDLLRSYFAAFANFYWIINLADAYKIINKQNPNLITFEELYKFSDIVADEHHYYYIVDMDEMWDDVQPTPENREIIAENLLAVDEENYYETVEMQCSKPMYVPNKEELLRYEDEYYYEKTPYSTAVENFIKNNLKISGEEFLDVMAEVTLAIIMGDDPIVSVFRSFGMMKIELTTAEAETFCKLFTNMANNFRMPVNRGYTPLELKKLFPSTNNTPPQIVLGENVKALIKSGELSVEDARESIINAQIPKETKLNLLAQISGNDKMIQAKNNISRNAQCPCGSGKKYKHCCGKL